LMTDIFIKAGVIENIQVHLHQPHFWKIYIHTN